MGPEDSSRCQHLNIMADAVRDGTSGTHPRYRPMLFMSWDWPRWNLRDSSRQHPRTLKTELAFERVDAGPPPMIAWYRSVVTGNV